MKHLQTFENYTYSNELELDEGLKDIADKAKNKVSRTFGFGGVPSLEKFKKKIEEYKKETGKYDPYAVAATFLFGTENNFKGNDSRRGHEYAVWNTAKNGYINPSNALGANTHATTKALSKETIKEKFEKHDINIDDFFNK